MMKGFWTIADCKRAFSKASSLSKSYLEGNSSKIVICGCTYLINGSVLCSRDSWSFYDSRKLSNVKTTLDYEVNDTVWLHASVNPAANKQTHTAQLLYTNKSDCEAGRFLSIGTQPPWRELFLATFLAGQAQRCDQAHSPKYGCEWVPQITLQNSIDTTHAFQIRLCTFCVHHGRGLMHLWARHSDCLMVIAWQPATWLRSAAIISYVSCLEWRDVYSDFVIVLFVQNCTL